MNAGEAIGLLVGLGDPPEAGSPLLVQEWNWASAISDAVESSAGEPVLRTLVLEAIGIILDLENCTPGDAFEEINRRHGFNAIRKRGKSAQ